MSWFVIALGVGMFSATALAVWALLAAYGRREKAQEAMVE